MTNLELVKKYADGVRSYSDISRLTGLHRNTVHRIVSKHDLSKRSQGGVMGVGVGSDNPNYKGGRSIMLNGYVRVLAPYAHPHKHANGYILEHRIVMESKIGRFLLPSEIVDHIDGLRLHNDPDNLRLFPSNAEHLRSTLTGARKNWSAQGLSSLRIKTSQPSGLLPVNMTQKAIRSGDYLTQQILLAMLQLGKDSPYLLGTHHHLEKVGIFDFSDSSLELALVDLYRKYA